MVRTRQPDFHKVWTDFFSGPPRKVRYEIRLASPNSGHDMIFLSSLVHDARFKPGEIVQRKNRLTLSLERDTWEMDPLGERGKPGELLPVKSRLSMSQVREVRWEFRGLVLPQHDTELMICGLDWISRQDDLLGLGIAGADWQLLVALDVDAGRIILQDQEVPHP